MRRFRLGPGGGSSFYSPGMVGTVGWRGRDERSLDREVEAISRVLAERGPLPRRELARAVNARRWGPGEFSHALHEAMAKGRARSLTRNVVAAVTPQGPDGAAEG